MGWFLGEDLLSRVRRLTPRPILSAVGRLVTRRFRDLSAREAFTRAYAENWWGGRKGGFFSGEGSDSLYATPYAQLVRQFIRRHHIERVVDLGCGDFRVGALLVSPDIHYIGVDVVEDLVKRNSERYSSERVEFRCADITAESLPPADLCLIRQVLQHLSNEEIEKVLKSCQRYRYVLVTEHVPVAAERANTEQGRGPTTRLLARSGVFLEKPPFGRAVTPVLELPYARGEVLRTVLLENP
jgi:SAM-dependent methyltransferase